MAKSFVFRNTKDFTISPYQNFKTSKAVLKKAIFFGGSTIRDFKKTDGKPGNFQQNFKVYGKNNIKCPRDNCEGYIKKIVVSQRSAFYCPKCQN